MHSEVKIARIHASPYHMFYPVTLRAIMKHKITIITALFFLFLNSLAAKDLLKQNLEEVFYATFHDSDKLKKSNLFQLLGYTSDEISNIDGITPKPDSLSIEYSVHSSEGDFASIAIKLNNISYYDLSINKAVLTFTNCKIDLQALKKGDLLFNKNSHIHIKTQLTDNNLTNAFNFLSKTSSFSGFKFAIENEKILVKARIKKGIFLTDFRISGNIYLVDSKNISFDCNKLLLNGKIAPRNVINSLFSNLNPVFSTENIWLNLNILDISVKKGLITAQALIRRRKEQRCQQNEEFLE